MTALSNPNGPSALTTPVVTPATLDYQTPVDPAAVPRHRNEMTDVVRLFAAAGIVFVHAAQSDYFNNWDNIARFAVPFFLFAGFYYQSLSLRRNPNKPLGRHILGRVHRIYLPFLAWCVIYFAARNVKRAIFLKGLGSVSLHPSMLWKGTEYHLWFLPYMLVMVLLLAVIHRPMEKYAAVLRWPAIVVATAVGLVFALLPMPTWFIDRFNDDNPTFVYYWWWLAIPATCWGMAFTWYMTLGPRVHRVTTVFGVLGILLAVGCVLFQCYAGRQPIARGLSGLGCMLAALAPWHGPVVSALARFGRLGYGIYLCHVLFVELIQAVAIHKFHGPTVAMDIVAFVLAFTFSVIFTTLIAKSRYTAWLNG